MKPKGLPRLWCALQGLLPLEPVSPPNRKPSFDEYLRPGTAGHPSCPHRGKNHDLLDRPDWLRTPVVALDVSRRPVRIA